MMVQLVEFVKDEIVAGRIATYSEVPLALETHESVFWRDFNKPFNFLKHGEKDGEVLLDIDTLENEKLLIRLVSIFVELTKRLTPEIEAFWISLMGDKPGAVAWSDRLCAEFGQFNRVQRRSQILEWLDIYDSIGYRRRPNYVSLVTRVDRAFDETGEL